MIRGQYHTISLQVWDTTNNVPASVSIGDITVWYAKDGDRTFTVNPYLSQVDPGKLGIIYAFMTPGMTDAEAISLGGTTSTGTTIVKSRFLTLEGPRPVDLVSISGTSLVTGSAGPTLRLKKLEIENASGDAVRLRVTSGAGEAINVKAAEGWAIGARGYVGGILGKSTDTGSGGCGIVGVGMNQDEANYLDGHGILGITDGGTAGRGAGIHGVSAGSEGVGIYGKGGKTGDGCCFIGGNTGGHAFSLYSSIGHGVYTSVSGNGYNVIDINGAGGVSIVSSVGSGVSMNTPANIPGFSLTAAGEGVSIISSETGLYIQGDNSYYGTYIVGGNAIRLAGNTADIVFEHATRPVNASILSTINYRLSTIGSHGPGSWQSTGNSYQPFIT